jgi:hypothetical protein
MADEADALYGLPDDEFTSARDALAKRLRAEKRREEADGVKALRRPSVAAGAINRAVREHGADEVLAAGEALRAAHEALLSGAGDAAAVREAMAREREAVREFAHLALGGEASGTTEEKVRATLHAASVDDDVREALAAGRLEREAEAGADPMALLAASAGRGAAKPDRSPRAKPNRPARAKPDRSASAKPDRSASAKPDRSAGPKAASSTRGRGRPSEAERRRAKAAERARAEAERAVAAQAEAEDAADRARSALAEAEDAARRARAVVEDLEGHERAARRAVKEAEAEAERRRTEARRAVKTAESRA